MSEDKVVNFPQAENEEALEGMFTGFFETLAEEGFSEDNTKEIAALISLPDEYFDVISEQVLAEMEDSMDDSSTRIM